MLNTGRHQETTSLMTSCCSTKFGFWSLENPWSSFLRSTPYWAQVAAAISPHLVELDYCMFGGSRKKHTCVATNCESLLELNILCDNQHEHVPWTFETGKLAISEEAAYPNAFSKAMATCAYRFLAQKYGFCDVDDKCISFKLLAFPAISTGQQPAKQLPGVVSFRVCMRCQDIRLRNPQVHATGKA